MFTRLLARLEGVFDTSIADLPKLLFLHPGGF
jgi:hypothetical protein